MLDTCCLARLSRFDCYQITSEDYQTTPSATATTIEQELLTLDLGLNHYYYCTIIVVPLGLHHQVEVEDRLTMVVFNRYPPRWYI